MYDLFFIKKSLKKRLHNKAMFRNIFDSIIRVSRAKNMGVSKSVCFFSAIPIRTISTFLGKTHISAVSRGLFDALMSFAHFLFCCFRKFAAPIKGMTFLKYWHGGILANV